MFPWILPWLAMRPWNLLWLALRLWIPSLASQGKKKGEDKSRWKGREKKEKNPICILEPLAQTLRYFPWTFREPRPCLQDPNLVWTQKSETSRDSSGDKCCKHAVHVSQLGFQSLMKQWPKQRGGGRVWFLRTTLGLYSITERSHLVEGFCFSGLIFMNFSVWCLLTPRTTFPDINPTPGSWTDPHQSSIKKYAPKTCLQARRMGLLFQLRFSPPRCF